MSIFPPTSKRVQYGTNQMINNWIEDETLERVENFKDADQISVYKRLYELDCEWDVDRVVETKSAAMVLAGTALGFLRHPKWFVLSGAGGFFLLQHALTGWCPSTPLLRRMGVRTAEEIAFEKELMEDFIEE